MAITVVAVSFQIAESSIYMRELVFLRRLGVGTGAVVGLGLYPI